MAALRVAHALFFSLMVGTALSALAEEKGAVDKLSAKLSQLGYEEGYDESRGMLVVVGEGECLFQGETDWRHLMLWRPQLFLCAELTAQRDMVKALRTKYHTRATRLAGFKDGQASTCQSSILSLMARQVLCRSVLLASAESCIDGSYRVAVALLLHVSESSGDKNSQRSGKRIDIAGECRQWGEQVGLAEMCGPMSFEASDGRMVCVGIGSELIDDCESDALRMQAVYDVTLARARTSLLVSLRAWVSSETTLKSEVLEGDTCVKSMVEGMFSSVNRESVGHYGSFSEVLAKTIAHPVSGRKMLVVMVCGRNAEENDCQYVVDRGVNQSSHCGLDNRPGQRHPLKIYNPTTGRFESAENSKETIKREEK